MAAGASTFANRTRLAYLFLMPALLVMGLVIFYPFIYNLVVSFSNMNLTHFHDWEIKGFSNYLLVLSESNFWYYLFKTVLWTVSNLVFHVGIGVFLALILNKDIRGKTIYRTLLILPWACLLYTSPSPRDPE